MARSLCADLSIVKQVLAHRQPGRGQRLEVEVQWAEPADTTSLTDSHLVYRTPAFAAYARRHTLSPKDFGLRDDWSHTVDATISRSGKEVLSAAGPSPSVGEALLDGVSAAAAPEAAAAPAGAEPAARVPEGAAGKTRRRVTWSPNDGVPLTSRGRVSSTAAAERADKAPEPQPDPPKRGRGRPKGSGKKGSAGTPAAEAAPVPLSPAVDAGRKRKSPRER